MDIQIIKNSGIYFVNSFDMSVGTMPVWSLIPILLVPFLIAVAMYLLRSIGIYVLAKRQKVDNLYLAFIPFAWVFLLCKLIPDVRFFGIPFSKIAVWVMISFIVKGVCDLVYDYFNYFPYIGYFFQDAEAMITFTSTEEGTIITAGANFFNPYANNSVLVLINNTCVIISRILAFINTVFTVFIYIDLFKLYWPEHYVIASVFSVLGLFPIFMFVIRKKDKINYMDYIRARYYGGYNPYGNRSENDEVPQHPFSEFAEKGDVDPGDPFSEFSDKDKK